MIKFNQTCFSDLSNLSDDELAGSVIIGFDIDWASDFHFGRYFATCVRAWSQTNLILDA